MATTPDGLHTPISNLTGGGPEAAEMVSKGEAGSAPGVAAPDAAGGEAMAAPVAMESAAAIAGPQLNLIDVGAASFGDPGLILETVHGVDNRVQVTNTNDFPFRINASLLITARDGSQWIGTGWFISARTLITAGHCVYITNSGVAGRDGWVKSIQVMPGRRDATTLPFGSATSSHFWTVKGWADTGDENFDYAAIILPTPLGDQVGFLGFASLPDNQLAGAVANVTGYPSDKDSGTLWYDRKEIATVTPSKVHYDIDTAGGQSGSAVYVIRDGERLAVAVHAYGGPTTNSGTRISPPVFANLTNWKA